MSRPVLIRTTRPGLWLPPAFFFGLSVVVLVAAPDAGAKLFYGLFAAATGYWLLRARRARVALTEDGLTVFGQIRTRRIAWTEIRQATAAPMRTTSPLKKWFPYVALTVELGDGRIVQFEEVSAAESHRATVDSIAAAVNGRL
jgi:hypothetical protein